MGSWGAALLDISSCLSFCHVHTWPYTKTPYAGFSQSGDFLENASVLVTSSSIIQIIRFARESSENGYAGHGFGTGSPSVFWLTILLPFGKVFSYVVIFSARWLCHIEQLSELGSRVLF